MYVDWVRVYQNTGAPPPPPTGLAAIAGNAQVSLSWDSVAGATSYYYFRGEQADGELVWVSPMWITYAPGR